MNFRHWAIRRLATLAAGAVVLSSPVASAQIFASTLPQARSTAVNGTVTAFASITNGSSTAAATNCRPALSASNVAPVAFSYQTTDSNNSLTGAANTAATIAAGGTQSYVFSVTANATYAGPVIIDFLCNGQTAPLNAGVNDFNLVAQQTAGADVIPIALTPSNDGVMRVSSVGGTQAMSAAAVNIGPTTTLNVTPIVIGGSIPVSLFVVETTSTGTVIGSPVSTLQLSFVSNTPRYFTVLAAADNRAGIPFAPDTVRVVLTFAETTGLLRGKTSAALTAPGPSAPSSVPLGIYDVTSRIDGSTSPLATTGGIALIVSPTEAIFHSIRRIFPSVGGQQIKYNQYVIPYNATFTGGPANGTMSLNSVAVFHDTNTTLLPGTSDGPDGVVSLSGTYNAGVGWLAAFAGVTSLGTNYTGTSTASYSTLNFQNATIPDFAGTWTVYDGTADNTFNPNVGTVTISATGVMSGTALGTCTISGQVTDPSTKPDILLATNFGLSGANCPNVFTAAKTYIYKMGTVTPITNAITPNGDYYGVMFWNTPDNANNLYLRRN